MFLWGILTGVVITLVIEVVILVIMAKFDKLEDEKESYYNPYDK